MIDGHNRDEEADDLLIEGAKSYPQALAAIGEFRQIVVTACRDAVRHALTELSNAMDIQLSGNDLASRMRPDKPEGADGQSATLGIRIDRDSEGWRQYYHLSWWKDRMGVTASIRYKDRKLAESVLIALTKTKLKPHYALRNEGGEVYLIREITSSDVEDLNGILRELIAEWVRLWKAAGRIKGLRAKQPTIGVP